MDHLHRTKVHQGQLAVRLPDQVLGFKIAMDHRWRQCMQIVQNPEHLQGHLTDLSFMGASPSLQAKQPRISTGSQCLDQVKASILGGVDFEVVDVVGNGRVAQLGEHLGFTLKQFQLFPVPQPPQRQFLERDLLLGFQVCGSVGAPRAPLGPADGGFGSDREWYRQADETVLTPTSPPWHCTSMVPHARRQTQAPPPWVPGPNSIHGPTKWYTEAQLALNALAPMVVSLEQDWSRATLNQLREADRAAHDWYRFVLIVSGPI